MGLISGGVSASDLILDGQSVSLYVGGNPPTKVWPTRDTVQITLGTDLEARDQLRAALSDRGFDYRTVEELPFDIELVGTGSARDMFRACAALTTAPAIDTSGVTNMRSMFNGCASLTTVPDMDTSGVTNMGWMFQDCPSLMTVPWMDTSNVTHMNSMFRACTSLTSVPNMDTIGVTDTSYMFYGCAALTDGNVLLIGKNPQVDTTNMIYGSGLTREPFDTVQITLGTDLEARDQLRAALTARGLNYQTVTKIPFIIELVGSGSARSMFHQYSALTHAPDMDTSQVTNMESMFSSCNHLTSVPDMDTSQVTNMARMFDYCQALTHAPVMDTSQVTDMTYMFRACSSLTYVPDMYTSQVVDMFGMFRDCAALTDGNVLLYGIHPNVRTSYMIDNSGLTKEPLIELVQITLGSGMGAQRDFRDALSARGLSYRTVTELPFGIEFVGTGAADSLFNACSALTSVPAMDTSRVTSMESMFYNCKALTTVPAMNTSQVTSMRSMFRGCSSLTYVPDMYTSQVTDAWYMFRDCSVLTDENVRLIGKNPSADTTGMIQNSGLTREPFYATSRLPNPPAPRVVTISRSSASYNQWDKNTVTGDASLIQGWVGNEGVRFAAYVICNEAVYISTGYATLNAGAVLPSGVDVKVAMRNVYTFTEVI